MQNKLVHKKLLREFKRMYSSRVSLLEIKRFITEPRKTASGDLTGIDQVNDIRNVLFMPRGAKRQVEILNKICGIEPGSSLPVYTDVTDPESSYKKSAITSSISIDDRAADTLMRIDKAIQPIMRQSYEKNILGKAGSMYSQKSFPGKTRPGIPSAWPLFKSLVGEVFDPDAESSKDVEKYFKTEKGKKPPGKYDPYAARQADPALSGYYDEDIVDAIVNDMVNIVLDVEDNPDFEDFEETHDRFYEMIEHIKEGGMINSPLAPDELASLRRIMEKEIASSESKILSREAERSARTPGVNFRQILQAIKNTFEQLASRFALKIPAEELPDKFVDLLGASVGLIPPVEATTGGNLATISIVPEDLDVAIGNFIDEVHDALMEMVYSERDLSLYIPVFEDEQPVFDESGMVTYEEDGVIDQHFDEQGKMYVTKWDEEVSGR